MMTQVSDRSRNLLLVGIFLLILVVFYFIVYQPRHTQITSSRTHIEQQDQSLKDLQRVASQKPIYLALTKQIRSRLRGVELTADPRKYVPSYLKQVENLAKADGLVVTSVVPQPIPSPSASPAAGGTPNPSAIQNAPIIGAPIRGAATVAGGEGAAAVSATQPSASPASAPGPAVPAPAAPVPGAAPGGVAAPAPGPVTPREKAVAYVTQSFAQVPVNMELQGTFANVRKFLKDLNKFPKLVGVGDVTLAQVGSATVGETPLLRITLPIIAYRLSPVSPAAPAPAPGATPSPGTAP